MKLTITESVLVMNSGNNTIVVMNLELFAVMFIMRMMINKIMKIIRKYENYDPLQKFPAG